MAIKGLDGLLGSINKATRTASTVSHLTRTIKTTGRDLKNTVGMGVKKRENDATPQNQPEEGSWVCVCGVSNTTKFCGGCGKPAPSELVCPNCQWIRTIENSNLKFCGNCGAKLEE